MTSNTWDSADLHDRDRAILSLNQHLLECVLSGDWSAYAGLCSNDLSCFEAETQGVLVEGLDFHQFYFSPTPAGNNRAQDTTPKAQVTMARPHVRWLGNDAVILSYTRLVQRLDSGEFSSSSCCETRVWQNINDQWKQVHVHRS